MKGKGKGGKGRREVSEKTNAINKNNTTTAVIKEPRLIGEMNPSKEKRRVTTAMK